MDDLEARVRCLELAAQICRPAGDYDALSVVKTATLIYKFVNASSEGEAPADEIVDKPRRGRPPKQAGLFD